MRLLDGSAQARVVVLTGMLVATVAMAACCVGVSSAATGVVGTFPVSSAFGVSSDGTHVWVTNYREPGGVTEIEASSGTVISTIAVGDGPEAVSSDGGHVWVADTDQNAVTEIEASSGTVIRTIHVGALPSGVSSDGTHVWVTDTNEELVSEIEASSGTVIRKIHVGSEPYAVSSDGTHVWVTNSGGDTVSEIEASSGTVMHTIHVGLRPIGVSSDGTHVWVANFGEDTVTEMEAASGFEASSGSECTANSGTVTLSPGLTDTAKVQTMKIKGTLTGCAGEPFTEAKYTATLRTVGPVSCSVLTGAGEPTTGTAIYTWTPKPQRAKTSKGTLSMPLTETPDIAFSGEVTTGSYSPLMLTGNAWESYTGGPTCGQVVGKKVAKAVNKGIISGSAVSF